MAKKNIIIVIAVTFVLVSCAIIIICTILSKQLNKQNELIVTVFTPELQKASDDFYSEYLSENPVVYNYLGKILNIKKSGFGYYIKFGVEPVIGPHDPVGYDIVEYYVTNSGNINLKSFAHKKNYDIPPQLDVTIKKPIPTS